MGMKHPLTQRWLYGHAQGGAARAQWRVDMALSVGEVQSRAGAEAGIQEPPPHPLPADTHNTPEEGKKMFEVHKHLCS